MNDYIDYSDGEDYGHYAMMRRMEREFGQNCDRARERLASAQVGAPIDLDVGVHYSSDYGLMTIEYGVSHVDRFQQFCTALEQFPSDRPIDSIKFHHFEIRGKSGVPVEHAQ